MGTPGKRSKRRNSPSPPTDAALDRLAAEFEREFVADTFGPPSAAANARLRRAKRKRGRPRIGAGAQAISVTVEKALLARVDRLAKRRKTTRASLIRRGLETVLAEEEAAE